MGTLYTLITGMSIVGIKILDIFLSFIFDCLSFTIAWKIGGLGFKFKNAWTITLLESYWYLCFISNCNKKYNFIGEFLWIN